MTSASHFPFDTRTYCSQYTVSPSIMMESSAFDDQIFCDFSGPLSPPGVRPQSVQVMLGMPNGSPDLCQQRLPEVHSLLPGAPKIDHYKTLEYSSPKTIDYKIGSYSPTAIKYDYGKCDQYGAAAKLDYGKHMDYMGGGAGVVVAGKIHHHDYSTPPPPQTGPPHAHHLQPKMDYDHNAMQMYHQPTSQPHQQQVGQAMTDNASGSVINDGTALVGGLAKKKDSDTNQCPSVAPTTTAGGADATASTGAAKKNDKKKIDPNGAKKKKTR